MHYKETKYGFEWGVAKIERLISDKGRVVMKLETPRALLEVSITKTGLVRIFDRKNAAEWKRVNG